MRKSPQAIFGPIGLVILLASCGTSGPTSSEPQVVQPQPPPGPYFKFTVQTADSIAIDYGGDINTAGQSVYGGPGTWTAYLQRDPSRPQFAELNASGDNRSGVVTCAISDETGPVLARDFTSPPKIAATCSYEPGLSATSSEPAPTESDTPDTDTGQPPAPDSGSDHSDHHSHVHVCVGKHILHVCS